MCLITQKKNGIARVSSTGEGKLPPKHSSKKKRERQGEREKKGERSGMYEIHSELPYRGQCTVSWSEAGTKSLSHVKDWLLPKH